MRKLLFLLLGLFCLSSCVESEIHLVSLLKKHYANLYVNHSSHKKHVVEKLQHYLKTHPLNAENEKEISLILNDLHDGHVVLQNDLQKTVNKVSDLIFIPGSMHVSECELSCNPKISRGKYEILSVDDVKFDQWLKDSSLLVAASSSWGRKFRASRLLVSNREDKKFKLKLRSSLGQEYITELRMIKDERPIENCIEGNRINKSTYYLKIKTLWCDKNDGEIEKNYKNDWDLATSSIKKTDKIIIDLRENNGGDDRAVVYSSNYFIKDPFILYRYQFLTLNRPGKLIRLLHLLPFTFRLWEKRGVDRTYPISELHNTFYDNEMRILVSAGCFSSCEGLASAFKIQKRAKLLGGQTHGGAGNPIFFPIAHSHYSINLPTCLSWQADGKLIEGEGVTPDQLMEDKLSTPGDYVLAEAIKK